MRKIRTKAQNYEMVTCGHQGKYNPAIAAIYNCGLDHTIEASAYSNTSRNVITVILIRSGQ